MVKNIDVQGCQEPAKWPIFWRGPGEVMSLSAMRKDLSTQECVCTHSCVDRSFLTSGPAPQPLFKVKPKNQIGF